MKTIFRFANVGLLVAAIMAFGAIAGMAQNPCEDADGITKLGDTFRAQYADKTIPGRQTAIDTGKQFLDKYGACDGAKELVDYLKVQIPKMEDALHKMKDAAAKAELTGRFDTALKAKNWDDVYTSGKEVLAKYPDEFRAAELVLGSIGYDELVERNNSKYTAETLNFAKKSLADLEGGKTFSSYGVNPFTYKDKDDAIAWMNLTIGYLTQVGMKDKTAAAPYLYKATQASASTTSKNPIPFALIGAYYFDALNKLVEQVKTAGASQNTTDTPEVAQKKVDDIKALVAMVNGTSERAMDAFSRAYTLGKDPAYKASMKKNVEDAYQLRFGKKDGVDAWIASTVSKPFLSPTSPIDPISDPEPAKTGEGGTGTGVGAANGTGVGAANGSGMGTANGSGVGGPKATTTTAKPASGPAKAASPIKPGAASVKKAVVKKKVV